MYKKVISSLLFLGTLLGTPGLGLAQLQGPHCSPQAGSRLHLMHHDGGHAIGGTATVASPSSHADCNHCTVTECATAVACSGASTLALTAPDSVHSAGSTHCQGVPRPRDVVHSTTVQPPTPPPQSVA